MSYIPGNTCQTQRRDQKNSEARRVRLKKKLFADDTTILSQATNMETAKQSIKELLRLFKGKTNDSKEENVTLGSQVQHPSPRSVDLRNRRHQCNDKAGNGSIRQGQTKTETLKVD